MGRWKGTLDLTDVWHNHVVNGEVDDVVTLSQDIIQRLREFSPELEDIVAEFETVSDIEDFDEAMSVLYDYADINRIWVKVLI